MSFLMYPRVFPISSSTKKYSDTSVLPTALFYGMERATGRREIEPGKTLIIKFQAVGDPLRMGGAPCFSN